MKRLLLCAMIAFASMPLFAELNGDGFYRVRNAYTKRYAYLTDDKGSYNVATTSADVGALKLYLDTERVISDPAAIFYIQSAPQGNDYYDICGQGTSVYRFIQLYLTIYKDRTPFDGESSYSIYASHSGLVKYLGDYWNDFSDDEGYASVDAKGDYRRWYLNPLDASSDEYFGVKPTVEAQGKHYASIFADFPFSAHSDGLKFYTISEIDSRGAAIINEVNGTVPASTPVIIECGSSLPSGNRLNIGGSADAVGGNKLKGVYFDNSSKRHYNRTPFDKESMRVLGVGKDGRLAFVEGDYDFIPRNVAYLQLTDPEQYKVKEYPLMTSEQRDIEFAAVDVIPLDSYVDVYGIDGCLVKAGIPMTDVHSLGKGIYIVKSLGKSQKLIVH